MEVIVFQVICLIVLFVVMTVSGSIPVIIIRSRKNVQLSGITGIILSVSNCVAGGVFMGMCFLGLFPFVKEKFRDVLEKMKLPTAFPVAEFVIGIGFFLILTLEQIVIYKQKTKSLVPVENSDLKFASSDNRIDDESHVRLLDSDAIEKQIENVSCNGLHPDDQSHFKGGHSHFETILLTDNTSYQRSFMLLLAVSVHSLFEGVTLGLQTDTAKLLHLFFAVLIHEVLVALALGVNIAKHVTGITKSMRYIVMATGSIPVGMIIGLVIGSTPGLLGNIISAGLQGIAAGIFIHVTFMEIMPQEFVRNKFELWKVLFFFIGFMIMALVSFFLSSYK